MQLLVPMAGFGERFRRAGHQVPKPLIQVHGRPMIAWVLDLFPDVRDPILIASSAHLEVADWRMREILHGLRPDARIVEVAPHRRGPVHSLVEALPLVDPSEDVVVSVCDLCFDWDPAHFERWIRATGADGCVLTYRGFHPHLLHSVHYAFARERHGRVLEIREKHAFTDDPIGQAEPCSNGVYWWRTGQLFADAVRAVHGDPALAISGEHYPSQCFQPMVEQGRDVVVYDVQHYLQWGNPRDLQEYLHHAEGFAARVRPAPPSPPGPGTLLVPMAGLGQRFADAGWSVPKPLIDVGGRPMAVQAARDLPARERQVFVLRGDMPGVDQVEAALCAGLPAATCVRLEGPTDGQARTVALGLARAGVDLDAPLVIGACDNGLRYDAARHEALLGEADVLVWAMRGHPGARVRPGHYGWIDAEGDRVRRLSVKVPLADPTTDPAIVGAFSFRRAGDFVRAFDRQVERDARVRGELYVDTLLEDALALGLDVRVFEVEHYYGWGTPDDLRTFTYWQGFFHHWPHHPYRLEQDPAVPTEALPELERRLAVRRPAPLGPRAS